MPTPYDNKSIVYIPLDVGVSISYIFKTNASGTTKTTLGIEDLDFTSAPTNPVFGIEYPIPGTATKKTATGWDSYFIASAKKTDAQNDGWSVSRVEYGTVIPAAATGALAVSKFCTTSGLKRAWNQPKYAANALTALGYTLDSDFGIEDCDISDITQYIWNSELPRTAVALIVNTSGTGGVDTHRVNVADAKISTLPNTARLVKVPYDWAQYAS